MSTDFAPWPWSTLGAEGPLETPAEVRRAYSRRLKEGDWSKDVAGFEALREAYEAALNRTGGGRRPRQVVKDLPPPPKPEHRPPRPAAAGIANPPAPEPERAEDPVEPAPETPPPPAPAPPRPVNDNDRALPDDGPEIAADRPAPPANEPAADEPDADAEAPDFWALLKEVRRRLGEGDFAADRWSAMLDASDLDDPRIRMSVEEELVAFVAEQKPGAIPADWAGLIDQRFGWRQDGVGFLRRHPDGAAALQRIVRALGRGKGPGVRRAFKWLFWLTILFFVGRYVLRYLDRYEVVTFDQLNDFAFVAGAGAAFGVIRLAIILWLAKRIARLLARFSTRIRSAVWRLSRSWAKPFFGMNRTLALYLAVICVPAIIVATDYLGPSARPGIRASMIRPLSEGLDDRFYLSRWNDVAIGGAPEALPLPRFILPRADRAVGDAGDPFDTAMLTGLELKRQSGVSDQHPPSVGPRALLECGSTGGAPPTCRLAMRADLIAIRAIEWPEGRRNSIVTMPVLELSGDGGDTVAVAWTNPVYTGIDSPEIERAMAAAKVSAFKVLTQLFLATLEYQGGEAAVLPLDKPVQTAVIPTAALNHPLALRFDWPVDMRDTVRCDRISSSSSGDVLARCGPTDLTTLRSGTWICPEGSTPEACEISPLRDKDAAAPVKPEAIRARSITARYDDPAMAALRELLTRMNRPGPHPPLADTPATRALRDAVLRDYALILDRPEVADHRRDQRALLAALTRQPHLFWTYRAGAQEREAVWRRLQTQLRELGFAIPAEALRGNGRNDE